MLSTALLLGGWGPSWVHHGWGGSCPPRCRPGMGYGMTGVGAVLFLICVGRRGGWPGGKNLLKCIMVGLALTFDVAVGRISKYFSCYGC